jgi:hypothetical protein
MGRCYSGRDASPRRPLTRPAWRVRRTRPTCGESRHLGISQSERFRCHVLSARRQNENCLGRYGLPGHNGDVYGLLIRKGTRERLNSALGVSHVKTVRMQFVQWVFLRFDQADSLLISTAARAVLVILPILPLSSTPPLPLSPSTLHRPHAQTADKVAS